MRLITFGVLATAALSGHLYASSVTCSFNGGVTSSTCYGAGVSFFSNDSLNFLTAFGSASRAPYNEQQNGPLTGTTANGVGVSVSLGPGGTMPGGLVVPAPNTTYISRIDNTQDVWAQNALAWDQPGDPGYTPNFMYYAGHFAAPTHTTTLSEASGGWGDYLLGPTAANGKAGNTPLVFTFSTPVSGVGFNISTVSGSTDDINTNFLAELDAYSGTTLLGSYFLTANGLGGYCPTVESFISNPSACNDAPFIGFTSSTRDITSVTVDAIDSTGNFGFLLANMVANDPDIPATPEPGEFLLCGSGMLILGLLGRKHLAPRRG